MKTAILVVSFGTTYLDTLQKTIAATEAYIADCFPNSGVYRAFTSKFIRAKLQNSYGIIVDDVPSALERIQADGFDRVIIQPTFLIPGGEYDRLQETVNNITTTLDIQMGHPLLHRDEDLDPIASLLQKEYPIDTDSILLVVGHGVDGSANTYYQKLARKIRQLKDSNMYLCTLIGEPSFQNALSEICQLKQRNIVLVPLMLVAGEHATHDILGPEPDSLRSMLCEAGFTVIPKMQGLGEMDAVRKLYVQRINEACTM